MDCERVSAVLILLLISLRVQTGFRPVFTLQVLVSHQIVICNIKIYEGHNIEGELVYFEVPNIFLSRKTAIKIIKNIPDIEVLKEEKREDVFCTFKIGKRVFEIMEPFGDKSMTQITTNTKINYQLQI